MHELSLAMSIVDLVEREAVKAQASRIRSLELEIGTLAGIEIESLLTSLQMVMERTVLQDTRVDISRVIPKATCEQCGSVFEPQNLYTPCPVCGSYETFLVNGREFRLKAIEIENIENE